jgi:hypothetical protein
VPDGCKPVAELAEVVEIRQVAWRDHDLEIAGVTASQTRHAMRQPGQRARSALIERSLTSA